MDYIISKIKLEIKEKVAAALDQPVDLAQLELDVPPESGWGDFALPCFYLAKLTRISPNQIAQELKSKIKTTGTIKSVQSVGPYLNFYLDEKYLAKQITKEIFKTQEKYGSAKSLPERVMIEYSQPNTHKEFHVGHLRNVVLGSALVNLYRFIGQKVIAANYIGDIGSHVAKCLWAYDKFHKDEPEPTEHKGQYLGQLYTEAVNLCEENEAYKKEASEVQKKLESGDKYFTNLWKKTRLWSLEEFDGIYKILGAKFDKIFYESEVEKPGKKIVAELLEKKIAEPSEGAVVIDLEKYGLKKFLLLKSDGSSLYSTKELALAKLKFEKYKIDASYVVVDARQSFYFKQFFKTLEILGFKKKTEHIAYEFVTLPEGAMSSRKGNVVLFEDFLTEVEKAAQTETKNRHSDWTEQEIKDSSRKLALAAIKFAMLRVNKNSVITFDIKEALAFDGYTGPYLLYAVSRINSLLKKEAIKPLKNVKIENLSQPKEKELLIALSYFPEVVSQSASEFEPSLLAKYLFDLARSFASYYQEVPILNSQTEIKEARLILAYEVRLVLVNGLKLLGLDTLDRM